MTRARIDVFGPPDEIAILNGPNQRYCDQPETVGTDVETVFHLDSRPQGGEWYCATCLLVTGPQGEDQ